MASKGGDRIMELKNRSQYLDKLISVQDMEVIKVVTGIRRCGKSSLLKLMMAHLREQGVVEEQILSMNFESMQFADMDSKRLYQYVMERAPKGKRLYLFFGRGSEGSGLAGCREFLPRGSGLRHLCDRFQRLPAFLRTVHVSVWALCGDQDAAAVLP